MNRRKAFLIAFSAFLMLVTSCKRVITEEIAPMSPNDPNVTFYDKPVVDDRTILVTKDAEIKSFTNTQIVFGSTKGLKAVRDYNRGGRLADYDIDEIREGAILVAYNAEATIEGFLVRVTGVVKDGSDIIVEYVDAKLDELFRDIHFKFSVPNTFTIPLDKKFEFEGKDDRFGNPKKVEIEVTGSKTFDYKTNFEILIKDSKTELISCLTTEITKTEVDVKERLPIVGDNGKKIYRKKLTIATFTVKKPFLVSVGPIPVKINLEFEVAAQLTADVNSYNVDFRIIDHRLEKKSGIVYENGGWTKIDEIVSDVSLPPVRSNIAIEGEIKASVTGAMNVSFYNQNRNRKFGADFTGVTLEIGYFGKVVGFCNSQKKGLGIQGSTGWEGRVYTDFDLFFTKLDKEYPFLLKETPRFGPIIINSFGFCSDSVFTDPIANDTQERSTASSNGDPHISTFDGASFSFMAAGEFSVLKSTSDNFEIQARQEEVKSLNSSGTVSWNTGLAIRTGNDKICFYPPNRILLNGRALGNNFQSQSLSNGGMIIKDGGTCVVTTSNQDEIKVYLRNVNLDYYVTPNQNRRGMLRGVLGNFDEQSQNDLQIQGGEVIKGAYNELYPRYADSWRIKQSESLFVYDTSKNTDTYTDRNFPRTPLNITAAQRNAARTICQKVGITDPILLENCIVDVASTNNNASLAEHYYDAQVSTQVLESFSIGGFSTSDVKLGYSGVTVTNKEAVLDTRLKSPAVILMRQGVDIRTGFVTEFSFSTNTLHPTSCFFLALWPTDTKFRNTSQNRIGFCFAIENGKPVTFFTSPSGTKIVEKQINNFVDGKNHRVKIVETQLPNRQWRVQLFLDNMFVPQFSVDNIQSIADMIRTPDKVGFIELQINQGVPSAVKVFNWSYNAL